jgi:hypothetical protein
LVVKIFAILLPWLIGDNVSFLIAVKVSNDVAFVEASGLYCGWNFNDVRFFEILLGLGLRRSS